MVVNGLPTALSTIHLADTAGKVYVARDVATGGQAELQEAGKTRHVTDLETVREFYATCWPMQIGKLGEDPAAFLQPGCYVATLDATPFVEEVLPNATQRRGRSTVIGIMKEPWHEN